MKIKSKGKSWSVTSHVIVPLVCFAVGLMLAASFTLGGHGGGAQSDASAQGVRLLECLGQTNDLENLKADLEHQLASAQQERDQLQQELKVAKTEVARATTAEAEARQQAARALSTANNGAGATVNPEPEVGAEEESVKNWEKETEEEGAWAKQVAAQGGGRKALQWQRLGVWQATELEPQSFSNAFDIGLPIDTIKWSGGTLLLPAKLGQGKKGAVTAILLSIASIFNNIIHFPSKPWRRSMLKNGGISHALVVTGAMEPHGSALDHVQAQCSELDVLVLNDNHCVAVTTVNGNQAGHNTPYHITRFMKGGYKRQGKRHAPEGGAPKGSEEWEQVSRLTSKSGSNEGAPPGQYALKTHRKALSKFFQRCDINT